MIAADFADGQLYITPPSDARYRLLADLGMDTEPDTLADVESISFEEVDRLNGLDVVMWITLPDVTIGTNELYVPQPVHRTARHLPVCRIGARARAHVRHFVEQPVHDEHVMQLVTAAADGDANTAAR